MLPISTHYFFHPSVLEKMLPKCDPQSLHKMSQVCKVTKQFIEKIFDEQLNRFKLVNFLKKVNVKLIEINPLNKFILLDEKARVAYDRKFKKTFTEEELENSQNLNEEAIDALADIKKSDLEKVIDPSVEAVLPDNIKVILATAQKKVNGLLALIQLKMWVRGCACVEKDIFNHKYSICPTPHKHDWHPSLMASAYSEKFGEHARPLVLPINFFYGIKEGDTVNFSDTNLLCSDDEYNYQLKCKGLSTITFENFLQWALKKPDFPAVISPETKQQHIEMFAEASKKYSASIGL